MQVKQLKKRQTTVVSNTVRLRNVSRATDFWDYPSFVGGLTPPFLADLRRSTCYTLAKSTHSLGILGFRAMFRIVFPPEIAVTVSAG